MAHRTDVTYKVDQSGITYMRDLTNRIVLQLELNSNQRKCPANWCIFRNLPWTAVLGQSCACYTLYTPFGISKTYNVKAIAGNERGELFQEELAASQDLNNSPPPLALIACGPSPIFRST